MSTQKNTYILGIESSCDDTSAAVFYNDQVLSNIVATQEVHKEYGGVVPELASRAHQQHIVPVVDQALKKANITKNDLSAIAYTRGPGLMGSLLVGSSFAKSLSLALEIPLIEVNHMQAHLLVHFINDTNSKSPKFPFLGVTISGGHTQIVKVKGYFEMEVIGETLDDSIGEAFDKCGKMLNLSYPAGPEIDKHSKLGDPQKFEFAKPNVKGLDFSFSGLKTSVLYYLQKQTRQNPNFIEENINDLCASFQRKVVDILISKLEKAVKETGIKEIAIGGGVSANSGIREALIEKKQTNQWNVFIPKFEYCTDNAAMIGIVGYLKFKENRFTDLSTASKARYAL
ncbi:tRNA (adenosine(37)-N6)-threonylcarbamoyltransferase complex transferase subunit TsaD [Psychroflexus sediminis]|uniref:tRNA N6-adenosine threonylcarbamoyltransferase n=1 Tax=Psychroflexus sediminis TaxID=470826 RepID=A0A1G7YQ83_9FLAO|nr:tRNA (adenosine(37)-N6)-threonylcarbamoyltransferase complex transferase subunit TsaD [Psychroflexus sediminis]SDG98455.1 O-sialoglycoprotein endopeptidase [Psychroflexus sediminis]